MAKRRRSREMVAVDQRPEVVQFGGGLEGAERTSKETLFWNASRLSPDQIINGVNGVFGSKVEADARSREVVTNEGYAQGVVDINRDSIVGSQFRLNSQPNFQVLQNEVSRTFDEVWAEEFQVALEEKFNLLADSNDCWFHASKELTFTGMVRMAIAGFVYTGECLATAEWIRQTGRPFNTAVQLISPMRLSNPNMSVDTITLRNGVEKDQWGAPIAYYIRDAYPTEFMNPGSFTWSRVPAQKPWGRHMVIHIKDAIQPSQTRGVAGLVAVLKEMRMTKKFQDIVLQNAVINASYAATIESDLPSEVVAAMMGSQSTTDAPQNVYMSFVQTYLNGLQSYLSNANGIHVDGAKMPHLFPGTKLNAKALGTPGGVGTEFEVSLLRHVSAGLGISYEEFANDFSRTNYSSGKASMLKTQKHMLARKKFVADRFADEVFTLWAEEDLNAGNLPMPRNYDWRILYVNDGGNIYTNPVVKEALFACDWVGAGQGQIDEMKETQAALLRINGGLSTHEIEIARQGGDYRKIFRQIAREQKLAKELDVSFDLTAEKTGAASGQQTMQDTSNSDQQNSDSGNGGGNGNNADGGGSNNEAPQLETLFNGMSDALTAAMKGVKPSEIHVHLPGRGVEVTRVTKMGENGEILEMEREEVNR